MAGKPSILGQVDKLEKRVGELDDEIDRCRRNINESKSSKRGLVLSLIVTVALVLLVTSSCSLHARELMGGPKVDESLDQARGALEGFAAQVGEHGEAAATAAQAVLTAINAAMQVLTLPVGLLRTIYDTVQEKVPDALPYLPYVELALVLGAIIHFLRRSTAISRRRYARGRVREERDRLRALKAELSEKRAELQNLKDSPDYETQKRAWSGQLEDGRRRLLEALPSDVSLASMESYLYEDPEKAAVVAELIDAQAAAHDLTLTNSGEDFVLSASREVGENRDAYRRYFQRMFSEQVLSDLVSELSGLRTMAEQDRRFAEKAAKYGF